MILLIYAPGGAQHPAAIEIEGPFGPREAGERAKFLRALYPSTTRVFILDGVIEVPSA